jgi:ABC-type multidrug transport system ATPase subunit
MIRRILVLDQGKVVEYGTPWELMQKEDGSFRDLCKQSGEEHQLFEVSAMWHKHEEDADE